MAIVIKNILCVRHADPVTKEWHTQTLNETNNCSTFLRSIHVIYDTYFYRYVNQVRNEGQVERLPRQLLCYNEALHFGQTSSVWGVTVTDLTEPARPELFRYPRYSSRWIKPRGFR